ncbi:MAG: hypothetical protein WCY11_05350 [Novosphingobium sp.]
MPKLLGRPGLVAVSAQAANITIVIAAAPGEWNDVIWHGCCRDDPLRLAVPAERLCLKAAAALHDSCPSAQSLSHVRHLKRTTPESLLAPGAVLNSLFRKVYDVCQVRSM